MSLEKKYIRDGKQRIIGSVTNGFDDATAVIRDEHNKITGMHQRPIPHHPRRTRELGVHQLP
jgi:hypothetical protein